MARSERVILAMLSTKDLLGGRHLSVKKIQILSWAKMVVRIKNVNISDFLIFCRPFAFQIN